ncbi:hypothetical protein [Pediococcus acidilactici]|nr:hypothetical protein [Pediococcus acidilactici]EFA26020.1 hypothetical protein HMPREF9024_01520 [Pediococcus acidilactici 7_4]GAC45136.1 hypothetical protein PLO_0608 [Pediococcus acidilactici NGRI 0510Q]APR28607.1 hypothetical protein BTW26_06100 [Pediococcus acidilactici]KRN91624.1 hypothetical protein IV82_GL000027 [Pediococcus acidilactici]MCB5721987.1 hypothetical protein [Pediococcus acidilactici]
MRWSTILKKIKQFLRSNQLQYSKKYIRPMMTPESVYVFKFGKEELNNRVIIKYTHTWTGRIKINEIDLRLHGQQSPRIFHRENELLAYLKKHLTEQDGVKDIKR